MTSSTPTSTPTSTPIPPRASRHVEGAITSLSVPRSRGVGRLATCLVALGALLVVWPGGRAAAGTDPEALLRRAREASGTATVAGIVQVRWRDGATIHVEQTGARARRGAYVVGRGDNVAVGAGGVRWAAEDGVATRWGHVDGAEPPRPGAAWDLELADGAEVAGRPCQVVVARRGDGPTRARFFVDEASGLLVRRDVLQADGDLVRSVRYTRLKTDHVTPAVPALPEGGPQAVPTDEIGAEYLAPDRLATGFRLLGRYEHPDGAVQMFYSDGLFSLSVFEQQGLVDWGSLPDGGRRTTVDSERAQWYATDVGSVVVWERGGLVLTGVSDAPPDTVRGAVAAVAGDDGDLIDDLVDFVLDPFGWE